MKPSFLLYLIQLEKHQAPVDNVDHYEDEGKEDPTVVIGPEQDSFRKSTLSHCNALHKE